MEPRVTSVSAYLAMLDTILKEAFPQVVIEAEVSEWKPWNNQRVYFKLKDDKGAMDCVMWSLPRVPIENGMTVRVVGRPGVYAARGTLSFSVSRIAPSGEGAIRRAYELLKAKLQAEGLFADERKRALPAYPQRIGLITAAGSAAYADFMKMINARWTGLTIQFVSAQVQGTGAPEQIVAALQTLNEAAEPVEVIALVRGGGSLEDLQAFNAETVVRAVAASRIPVVSGVGHEVDTSLTDLVADLRAATPTDAANRIVPERHEVLVRLGVVGEHQERLVQRLLDEQYRVVQRAEQRLDSYVRLAVGRLDHYEQRLRRFPEQAARRLAETTQRIARDELRIERTLAMRLERATRSVEHLSEKLELLNPRAVLGRGFAIARIDGRVVKSGAELRAGQTMVVELASDLIDSTVTGVRRAKTDR